MSTAAREEDWTCPQCHVVNFGWRKRCFNHKTLSCAATRPLQENAEELRAQWNERLRCEWFCESCKLENSDKATNCRKCLQSRALCTHTDHCTVALICDSRGGNIALRNARYIMNNTTNNVEVSCLVAKLMVTHKLSVFKAVANFKRDVYALSGELGLSVADVIDKMLECDGDPVFVRALTVKKHDTVQSTAWADACSTVARQHESMASMLKVQVFCDDDEQQTSCVVCLQHIDEQNAVSLQPCGDAGVCRACACELLARNMNCPMCGEGLHGVCRDTDSKWLQNSRLPLYIGLRACH